MNRILVKVLKTHENCLEVNKSLTILELTSNSVQSELAD